jgi:uracil-DNA glycosylase
VDEMAARVHACPGCDAVDKGILEMKREAGIFPRGLFVWPPEKDLADVDLVILGENPGRAPLAERAMYMLLDERHSWQIEPTAALGRLSALLATGDWEESGSYWRNAVRLVCALYPSGAHNRPVGFPCTVAGMEVAYCQSPASKVAGKAHWDAITLCAGKHLSEQMALVSKDAIVMCLGGPARYWMASQPKQGRRWFWIDHLSGSWGALYRLIRIEDGAPRLWPCVEEEWKSVRDGGGPLKLGDHHGKGARRCGMLGCDWMRTNPPLATDESQDPPPAFVRTTFRRESGSKLKTLNGHSGCQP